MIKKCLLLSFMMYCNIINVVGQNFELGLPFIKYYSTNEYHGGIQNWAITQNKYGLVYVANNFGVLEFDGSSWDIYIRKEGTKVRYISIANDGKIYTASQGDFGYLFPNANGELTYTSLADSLPAQYRNFDEAWRVFQDHDRLIFCTFRQIFIYNADGSIDIIEPKDAPENFFYNNHQLYVHQPNKGLSYLDGNVLKLLPNGDKLKDHIVTGIINLPNNKLWISTLHDGIYIFDGVDYKPWDAVVNKRLGSSAINCALRLRNGNYAIGTQNNGLFILSPEGEVVLHLNKTRGLSNRTVLCLFEDAQNNLWLGHNNGITSIELDMPFTYINEQVGLPGTGYDGFLDQNTLYLGTNNGLYIKDISADSGKNYQFMKGTEGQVYNIDKIQDMLVLGHHEGAFQLYNGEVRQISDILGAWTFLRLKDNPKYIIEGTYKGLILYRENNGRLTFQHKIAGFEESSRVMQQDESGDIWMTHGYKGVYRLKLNERLDSIISVKFYGKDSGLPSNILINVYKIGNRLVFTSENEIYKYDSKTDRFVVDSFFEEFFNNDPVIALAEDPLQNIYYISIRDIGVLKKDASGVYHKHSSIFNKLRDMLNDDLQNVSILNANQALFAAKEGFILYTGGGADIADRPFYTLMRKVVSTGDSTRQRFGGNYVDNNELSNNQPISSIPEIPFKQNSLQFSYSAPFVDGLNKTVYQYWLENDEKDWSDWTLRTEKEDTNRKEGTYIFHVRAKNIYGKVSKPATYKFIILPPWYRTNLAYIIYASLILILLFIVFYLFEKKHKKQTELLAIRQAKELHKKETEIESITKKSAEAIERLKNEKLEAEIQSKNKELATSTMHLINKNGFIATIKSNLSSISKRSKNQEVKNELKKVMNHIDKNISQDDDWQHFSIHFDQVHGDFSSRLKDAYPTLSPQEMKLSAYLRMNLSTKEIAHLLNISVRGVEIARYRLRKKLELERAMNLQEFILKF